MDDHHVGITKDGSFVEVHDAPTPGSRIETLYAVLAVTKDGDEGIVGLKTKVGYLPMVTSDKELIDLFAEQAVKMAEVSNCTTVLVEFSNRREVRTLFKGSA